MSRFLTIGYGDERGYRATDTQTREQAHAHDAWLAQQGAVMGIAGSPIQVRNPDGAGVMNQSGPYLRSDLPVAGFALIEAKNLEEAIDLVAGTPCAVAHGVVEVWPMLSELPRAPTQP